MISHFLNLLKSQVATIAILLFTVNTVIAQTPSDAVIMKGGEICLGASYNNNSWSQYWEGDLLRENGNIGTLTTHSVSGGLQLGIIDRINLIAMLPYVITSPSAGYVAGDEGYQDISLFIKGLILDKEIGPGSLKLLATIGLTTPVGSYAPEHAYALGVGCPDGILRGIIQYGFDNGFYARINSGYHLRGTTEIVREYYYTTHGIWWERIK